MHHESNSKKRCAPEPGGMAELWLMAFPVIVATLSQSMMGVVDTIFMGKIGTAEQSAVGYAGIIMWTLTSFGVGTLHGVSTFAAQHLGAGENEKVGRDGWLGLFLTVPAALLMLGVAFFALPIFELLNTDLAVLSHAADYLSIRLYGSLFVFINYALLIWLRGIGDTRTPMYLALGGNILNALLNYPLILGHWGCPRMGAAGAAVASAIATAVFSLVYLAIFLSGERRRRFQTGRFRVSKPSEVLPFLKVGLPIGASWTLEMVSWSAFMMIVGWLGVVQLAATNIVFQVLHFSFMGAMALGTAATTLVGQYLGAEDEGTAAKTARTTIRSAVIYCVTLGLIFVMARHEIVRIFNSERAVIEVGGKIFIYAAVFQFFDGLGISCTGVLRGAGDTRWTMILMAVLAWFVFIPLTYTLTALAGLGIDGAWSAATVFIILVGSGMYMRHRSGKWKSMRV